MPQHLYIITGASRGMGLALAYALLNSNHRVLGISRQSNEALQVAAQTQSAPLTQWTLDLSDSEAAALALQVWLSGLKPEDIASATLINNAGVIPTIAPLSGSQPGEVARALRVGLEAPMLLTHAFLNATLGWVNAGWRGPRKVLNISSGLGRRPMASQAPYCAAKAGMDHFSRCVALDEAQHAHGARVVSLAPGVIDTDMQVHLRGADAAQFPDRSRFVSLQTDGALSSSQDAAARLVRYLNQPDFGNTVVDDLRA
jgi:NAD(P)-dependent dehydrogenase (short-subunit alcohol dehydrogenase family)